MNKVAEPYVLPDVHQSAGELRNGKWVVIRYEAYGLLDRDEWNVELVNYLAELDIDAYVIDLSEKDVVVVVNIRALPTRDQVAASVSAIEHHRFTGRPIRDELAVKTGRS